MTYFTLRSYSEMFPSRDSYHSIQFPEATTTSCVSHCALQMINFKLLITRVLGHVYLQHKIPMPMWHQNRIHKGSHEDT